MGQSIACLAQIRLLSWGGEAVAIDSIGPICPHIIGLGCFLFLLAPCSDLGLIIQTRYIYCLSMGELLL